ncbi:AGE family epimerase/isomerase [Plebeiibacterium marinum]|uniref:Cellobiose 2-epimerase n=1 Tax=Plebeiibacterium marinum TaxID=2992111 RepID=A0AAE3SLA6_9BACT|nr:AGE family epimerase/isomerase [Plebeiobacterium marinum]MCW3806365.1 AGE family epimerase/isomerase [Plebeiobacterium marinum]
MIEELKNNVVPQLQEELQSILDFWISNVQDGNHGGFIGEIDGNGCRNDKADKSAVLNTRLLWTFSAAYNLYKNPVYLEMAEKAYDYLVANFWDKENGGLVWSVDYKGEVKDSHKQAYAQGFGIYGFSEYYMASENKQSLEYAIELYNLIENNFKDEVYGGYIEALSCSWLPMEDMRLSAKDANEPKSMNTHLHIIEPYTNLYRVWPDEGLKLQIKDLLKTFRDRIIDGSSYHFNLFFDVDWAVKSDIVSYGHDIEGAWLLNEAVQVIKDEELITIMKDISLKMADVTIQEGLDMDGGIFYEKEKNHLDTDKHWWPQAEAMVGFLDAYQNSFDMKYLEAAKNSWTFILNHIKDKEKGEWFWKVNKEGIADPVPPKVGFWKCPYHNSRALIESIRRIKHEI